MLDNVRAFTSTDEFIANNIYKVVRHNFSDDGSIILQIEGDISSFEFSLALISMLPAFDKLSIQKSLNLRYSNLNDENLEEALLIEAVKSLYPDQLVGYLLTRAECLFEVNGFQVMEDMNMDLDKIIEYRKLLTSTSKTKTKFSKENNHKYLVLVNAIEFKMTPSFYAKSGEPTLYLDQSGNCEWGDIDCISRVVNIQLQGVTDDGVNLELNFPKHKFISNEKDLYVSLIGFSSDINFTMYDKFENYFNPSNSFIKSMSNHGYTGLA